MRDRGERGQARSLAQLPPVSGHKTAARNSVAPPPEVDPGLRKVQRIDPRRHGASSPASSCARGHPSVMCGDRLCTHRDRCTGYRRGPGRRVRQLRSGSPCTIETTHKAREGLLAARVPERPAPGRVDVVVRHEPGLITRSGQVDVQTPVRRTTEEQADPTIEVKMSRPDTRVAGAIWVGPCEPLDCAKAPTNRISGKPSHGRRGPRRQLPHHRPTGVVEPRLVSRSWPLSLCHRHYCADD